MYSVEEILDAVENVAETYGYDSFGYREKLRAMLEANAAEYEKSKKDSKRLDFMIQSGAQANRASSKHRVSTSEQILSDWQDTPRDAIDNAMGVK